MRAVLLDDGYMYKTASTRTQTHTRTSARPPSRTPAQLCTRMQPCPVFHKMLTWVLARLETNLIRCFLQLCTNNKSDVIASAQFSSWQLGTRHKEIQTNFHEISFLKLLMEYVS